jgi:hypothetical protein
VDWPTRYAITLYTPTAASPAASAANATKSSMANRRRASVSSTRSAIDIT